MAPYFAKILVVDDNATTVDSLSTILRLSGFEAFPAYSGHEALRMLNQENFDIVVCDIEMPGMSGLDLLKHIRNEHGDDVSFILMTGYLEQDYFIKAIRLGASDFISKPIDAEQIINAIKMQLEKRKTNWEYYEVSKLVDSADIKLVLTPQMFREVDFLKVFTKFFKQNFNLSAAIMNEILLCLEEMLYNAFIHGTLKLNTNERTISYEDYQNIVSEKLNDPCIAQKKIYMRLFINNNKKTIQIEVEDEGDGFNYHEWLSQITSSDKIRLDEYGRGISIIYHLCDKVEFNKGGRQITIEKSLKHQSHAK